MAKTIEATPALPMDLPETPLMGAVNVDLSAADRGFLREAMPVLRLIVEAMDRAAYQDLRRARASGKERVRMPESVVTVEHVEDFLRFCASCATERDEVAA